MTILKKYDMQLLTLGPVHIGSGSSYYPKEYIHEKGNYYFPDMEKVYYAVEKKGERSKEAFENYLLTARTTERLVDFLKQQNIKDRDFGGYAIRATGLEKSPETKGRQLNEITAFIKDPYKKPYIPGSSLKGAIRTILANEHFQTDRVPNEFYNSIRVSDSEPLELSDLIIVQKVDYSNPKKDTNELPLYREAIAPLTMINFTITCEGKEAQEVIEKLGTYATQHYKHYEDHFLNEGPNRYKQSALSSNIIYLGGGSGFWTKTIIDQAIQPRGTPRMRMVGKGVHKLTRAQVLKEKDGKVKKIGSGRLVSNTESMFEMGKCFFIIRE